MLFLIVIGAYLALSLLAVFLSDGVIFQPHSPGYRDGPEILKLTSRDGARISAVYLANPGATYTLLFSHGNAEDLGDGLPFLHDLHDAGFAVLAYDYQGYGTSEGKPSEQHVYEDVDAAYEYLTGTLQVPAEHVIAFGRSLGGAVAVDLAARRPVAGLVVESSFTTAFRVLTRAPLLPFDKFRSIDKIARVRCPVLVMHGTADEVIPFSHGPKLLARANPPKRSWWIQGAGHNDVAMLGGKKYYSALQEFAKWVGENRAAAK